MPTSSCDTKRCTGEMLPTLPEVIDRIGLGPAQLRAAFTGGGVWFADGSELLLISSVTKAVSDDWRLSPMERGLIVTIVFIGVLIGNLVCGPIGDSLGRRHIIIVSYVGIFVFSILSSVTTGFTSLSIARLFVGMSFGFGQPAWNVLGSEITPSAWRVLMMGFSFMLFAIGEAFSAILLIVDDPTLKHLHWRWLLRMGAIPSLCFCIVAYMFLHQSPVYLALYGRYMDAMKVLESMSYDNFSPDLPVDFRSSSATSSEGSIESLNWQFGAVFGRYLFGSTVILIYTMFVLNLVFYGTLYAFPQVLSEVSSNNMSAGMQLLIGALWELLGNLLGIVLGMSFPRKPAMKLFIAAQAVSIVSFVVSSTRPMTWVVQLFYFLGYFGIKCFCCSGCVVVTLYTLEVYPTEMRTTGAAIAMASGRIGAMVAPVLFEGFHQYFFYLLALLGAVNLFFLDYLPFETAGKHLVDRMSELSAGSETTQTAYGLAT